LGEEHYALRAHFGGVHVVEALHDEGAVGDAGQLDEELLHDEALVHDGVQGHGGLLHDDPPLPHGVLHGVDHGDPRPHAHGALHDELHDELHDGVPFHQVRPNLLSRA